MLISCFTAYIYNIYIFRPSITSSDGHWMSVCIRCWVSESSKLLSGLQRLDRSVTDWLPPPEYCDPGRAIVGAGSPCSGRSRSQGPGHHTHYWQFGTRAPDCEERTVSTWNSIALVVNKLILRDRNQGRFCPFVVLARFCRRYQHLFWV